MKRHILTRMKRLVEKENKYVQLECQDDRKELKHYDGNFIWGFSKNGTNLIYPDAKFSYLQVEAIEQQMCVYVCITGKLRKITREKAVRIAICYYSRKWCG